MCSWGFPSGSAVKNPPAMQELQVRSLGWEDPLDGGHGNLLRYSCLENLMDRGAWRAKVHSITKRWTWLKWLSMHTCRTVFLGYPFPGNKVDGFYRASDQSKSRQYWFAALHLCSGTMTMFMTSCVTQPPFVMTVRMFGFVCTELCCEYLFAGIQADPFCCGCFRWKQSPCVLVPELHIIIVGIPKHQHLWHVLQ